LRLSTKHIFSVFMATVILASCASKRRKDKEPSALGKFYHNTTAQYNGYFNANEIMKETYLSLQSTHQDNYTDILPVYDYINAPDPKSVSGELDRAIEKVTTVAMLHKPSHWVDDCYVLMGEAQYLKKDYETAEETFQYFKEEFNPTNPFGRNYAKKKVSKKAIKKQREKERKEAQKEKQKEKKEKQKERDQAKKEREAEKKRQKKEREAKQKERKKEKKKRKKNKTKKRKRGGKKKRPPKSEPKETKEPVVETKVDEVKEKVQPESSKKKEEEKPDEADEEQVIDNKEKKKKKDKTAYSEGLMWLAKTYVQRDKYSLAKYTVNKIKYDGVAPKRVMRELPVILADVYIKENNYAEALINLDEAIESANKKDLC